MNAAKPPVDFLFIGPSKTGSTWIFELLRSHPDVFVPRAKDLQFFDRFYDKGWDWYVSYFAAADGRIAGEVSHDYILHTKPAIQRIREHLPRVKLICCLRDPYERAASGANFLRRNGLAGYDEPIAEIARRHPELLIGGQHCRNLAGVFAHFPRSQVLVLRFDDLAADPERFARRIYEFLGVPPVDSPLIGRVVNPQRRPRHVALARLVKSAARRARIVGLPGLVGAVKHNTLVMRVLYRSERGECVLSEADLSVLRPYFNADIEALHRDLGFDCLHWKR